MVVGLEVILIPFEHTEDIDRFARKHNVKKYTGIYLPDRGINHPKKFVIVIEAWDNKDIPKEIKESFYHQNWRLGYGSDNINILKEINEEDKHIRKWDNPYVFWKLISGKYILFSANIEKPLFIFIY